MAVATVANSKPLNISDFIFIEKNITVYNCFSLRGMRYNMDLQNIWDVNNQTVSDEQANSYHIAVYMEITQATLHQTLYNMLYVLFF